MIAYNRIKNPDTQYNRIANPIVLSRKDVMRRADAEGEAGDRIGLGW